MERVHPDDRGVMLETWMAMLANQSEAQRCRARVLRGDGTFRWFEFTYFNRLEDPERPHVVTEMLDVSDEMAAHEAVAAREQLLHRLAEALPLGVMQLDAERRVVYRNDKLGEILGRVKATTLDEQLAAVVPEDRPQLDKAFSSAFQEGVDDDVIVRVLARGAERLVRVITKSLATPGSDALSGVIACVSDVTEATLMGRELERRATYDSLTGCHNRAAILAWLGSSLDGHDGGVAVIYLDLDDFKEVNDRLGHAAGDELLKSTVRAMQSATRPTDLIGRLGGDEFLVVCQDVGDPETAMSVARRISDALRSSSSPAGAPRASIGIALARRGTVDAGELVHRADQAMYASKREAAGRPHVWDDLLGG